MWDLLLLREGFKLVGHEMRVNCVKRMEENSLLSCSDDGSVLLWDLKERLLLRKLEGEGASANTFCLSPNKQVLYVGCEGFVRSISTKTWQVVWEERGEELAWTYCMGCAEGDLFVGTNDGKVLKFDAIGTLHELCAVVDVWDLLVYRDGCSIFLIIATSFSCMELSL